MCEPYCSTNTVATLNGLAMPAGQQPEVVAAMSLFLQQHDENSSASGPAGLRNMGSNGSWAPGKGKRRPIPETASGDNGGFMRKPAGKLDQR